MPNIVINSIVIYKKLQDVYRESIYDSLEQPANKLMGIFQELLDSKAEEYKLKKDNSFYDSKFYYLKKRVKGVDSFYEKLIRKEIGIKLTTKLDLLSDIDNSVTKKIAEIATDIKLLEDIIGIRIVTELKADCMSVYNLILNSPDFFQRKSIKFSNLSVQPEKMLNGLEIYRIKGVLEGLYGFELQIKSKINETWGDLDHVLFYKDYSSSPIKDTVQITMNNVGSLLDEIEKLLYDLRESRGNYDDNASRLQIQKGLEDELSALLFETYEAPYNIRDHSSLLYYFRSELAIGDQKLTKLTFDHLELSPTKQINIKYIKIRNSSLALTNLESIYINWVILKGESVSNDTIDLLLTTFIEGLNHIISTEIDIEDFPFEEYMTNLITYCCSSDIFLNPIKHTDAIKIFNRISGILSDMEECGTDKIKNVSFLFSIYFFNGNYLEYIGENSEEESDFNHYLIQIKDQISESPNPLDIKINQMSNQILKSIIK